MPARHGLVLGILLALAALMSAGARGQGPPSSESAYPQQAAADPSPADAGLGPELEARLAAGGARSAREREERAALARFYAGRRGEPVWVGEAGLTAAGSGVLAELRRADEWGLDPAAFALPSLPAGAALGRAERADAEVALSLAVLAYARHARGGRAEPASLSKYLDRPLRLPDPGEAIAAAAAQPDAYLRSLHPRHPQFEALRRKYLSLKRGEGAPAAAASDTAVLRRLLVNMEAWRWMPEDLGDFHIWVAIPEFTLRVVKAGRVIHSERAIVGKVDTQTPVFSADLEQVIFHPFWGVPDSIKRNDILPSLARGSTRLLARYNLKIQRGGRTVDPESIDWASADIRQFHVYQPPGGNNVLGVVKFRFPNKHDVYMHDTPTKNLFNAQVRAFSHGCVRVREPQRLAELVLAEDQGWPAARVASAVGSGPQNNQVGLARKVPVHMTYFTARVDDDGRLHLFPDIYGHETKIALGMEGKAHLIPRWKEDKGPVRADAVGRLAETVTGGSMRSKKEWVNRAFENN